MTPYFQEGCVTIFNQNCLNMGLPDESVQCVVTSPPYWGLRKYDGEQDVNEWNCAYGLETAPGMYVQHTVEVMREVWRVLRKDGVAFWNIGDSYIGSWGSMSHDLMGKAKRAGTNKRPVTSFTNNGYKAKDMCLIPQRVAIALQSDGWWVRSDIIWHKPNPMPESVKDRPTNSYEHILMLTKSAYYFWDQEAVKTQTQGNEHDKHARISRKRFPTKIINGIRQEGYYLTSNLRDVWSFPTQPYPDAHFAVFPERLPELCIKAATSEKGCCPKCGAPWTRIIDKQKDKITRRTVGWTPSCGCGLPPISCIVLDPFAGSGTTLAVAQKLNRQAIGFEISEKYCELIRKRCKQGVLGI